MTATDIFLRNVFFVFLPGVFELMQLGLSLVVFLSVAHAQDNYEHVYIDVLYEALPRPGKRFFSFLSSILYLAVNGLLTYYVYSFAIAQISRGNHSATLEIPLWPISMIAAFGMFLYCLSVIGDLIYIIKDREVLTLDPS